MALVHYSRAFGWIIAAGLLCASCSGNAEKPLSANQASATPSAAPSSPSPTPTFAPLKTPESVASGKVTESRGSWNAMVQQIMYLSSADNTQQPMMFYKPKVDEPRPLLVAL